MPPNEVFLTCSKKQNEKSGSETDNSNLNKLLGKGAASGTKKRAMHIKRFDPSNPLTSALKIEKEEAIKKKKVFEQGRKAIETKR